jgi:hypothetical protein
MDGVQCEARTKKGTKKSKGKVPSSAFWRDDYFYR